MIICFFSFKKAKIKTSSTLEQIKRIPQVITFDDRLVTENNLADDVRPFIHEPHREEQINLQAANNNDEVDNDADEYNFNNQNENSPQIFAIVVSNESNIIKQFYTESTISAKSPSQTDTPTNSEFVII